VAYSRTETGTSSDTRPSIIGTVRVFWCSNMGGQPVAIVRLTKLLSECGPGHSSLLSCHLSSTGNRCAITETITVAPVFFCHLVAEPTLLPNTSHIQMIQTAGGFGRYPFLSFAHITTAYVSAPGTFSATPCLGGQILHHPTSICLSMIPWRCARNIRIPCVALPLDIGTQAVLPSKPAVPEFTNTI